MNVAPSLGIFWVFYVGKTQIRCRFGVSLLTRGQWCSSSKPSRENLPGKDTIEFFETFAWLKPPKGVGVVPVGSRLGSRSGFFWKLLGWLDWGSLEQRWRSKGLGEVVLIPGDVTVWPERQRLMSQICFNYINDGSDFMLLRYIFRVLITWYI